jgi:hypothetical protein
VFVLSGGLEMGSEMGISFLASQSFLIGLRGLLLSLNTFSFHLSACHTTFCFFFKFWTEQESEKKVCKLFFKLFLNFTDFAEEEGEEE